jgi:phosphate transport system permease protein
MTEEGRALAGAGSGETDLKAVERELSRRRAKVDEALADRIVRYACLAASLVSVLLLAVLVIVMVQAAIPAAIYSGFGFVTGTIFTFGNLFAGTPTIHNGVTAPHNAQYGAATIITGTLLTSLIALGVAIPVSVGGVLMLVERIPHRFQGWLSIFLELLAGIPSVVYGLWGIIIFGPLLAQHVYPIMAVVLGWLPLFRGPVGSGQGLLTASLVLAVMIIPVIAATTRDLLRTVPVLHKEGALALGMTRYETVKVVTIPFIRNGIVAASILGWARALGETMAVLMISGNALNIFPHNIYAPVSTIAATIASQLDGALEDATGLAASALAEAGLVLLAITLLTNALARYIVRRTSGAALPVGRGF